MRELLQRTQTRRAHGEHISLDNDSRNAWTRAERVQVLLARNVRNSVAMTLRHNSIDTDPQQQEAASPQVLVARSFLR